MSGSTPASSATIAWSRRSLNALPAVVPFQFPRHTYAPDADADVWCDPWRQLRGPRPQWRDIALQLHRAAVAANVVDTRAQVVVACGGLSAHTLRRLRIQNSTCYHCARSRLGKLAQPLAMRQQCVSVLLLSWIAQGCRSSPWCGANCIEYCAELVPARRQRTIRGCTSAAFGRIDVNAANFGVDWLNCDAAEFYASSSISNSISASIPTISRQFLRGHQCGGTHGAGCTCKPLP